MQQFQEINLQQSKQQIRRPQSRSTIDMRRETVAFAKLKKENQYLRTLINKIQQKTPTNRPGTAATNRTNNNYTYKQMIAAEKSQIAKLDEQITQLKKQSWAKKNPQIGVVLERQIKVLETRLDKGTSKLNDTLAQVKQVRSLIDNLRRQKAIFQSLYHKLEKQLQQKRKEMANIIQKANQSYQQRDRATQYLQNIKNQERKQTFDFEKKLKQLSMITEKSKIGQYSVSTRRPLSSQQTVERPRTAKKKENPVNMKKLQKLREDFKKIENATNVSNFSQLIKIFKKNEEQNFKKFKILNQEAHQIQDLQEQLAELNRQAKQQSINQTQPDKRIQQASKKLESAQSKQAQIYAEHREASKNLASLLNYVEKMHLSLTKGKQNKQVLISQTSVMSFLQKIEQKAVIISKFYKQQNKSQSKPQSISNNKISPKKDTFMFDNYLDDEEQYDKILTHQDFIKKASQRFAGKKASGQNTQGRNPRK